MRKHAGLALGSPASVVLYSKQLYNLAYTLLTSNLIDMLLSYSTKVIIRDYNTSHYRLVRRDCIID